MKIVLRLPNRRAERLNIDDLGMSPRELLGARIRKGRGCPQCRFTGCKGRTAVFELLVLNEAVRDGLIQRKTGHQIRKISTETTGLVTLFEDGFFKAAREASMLGLSEIFLAKLEFTLEDTLLLGSISDALPLAVEKSETVQPFRKIIQVA